MKSSNIRLLMVILILLLAVGIWWWRNDAASGRTGVEGATANLDGTQSQVSSPAGEVAGPASRSKRPELLKKASDAESLEGNEVASSAVHTIIPAGHSMVTGGYVTGNGRREFVVLTPKWLETPSGKKQVMMESKILNVDQQALLSTGLDSLVTGEQKSRQNAEVWTPEDVARTLADVEGLNQLSSPTIVLEAGSIGLISIRSDKAYFMLDVQAQEAADGGFDLKTEIKRVE